LNCHLTSRHWPVRFALGLALGFVGLCVIIKPSASEPNTDMEIWGKLALVFAACSWSAGAIYSRHVHATGSPLLPMARQAPRERSIARPAIKGPRSFIVTTTLAPLCSFVTLTLVPKAQLRCAAVIPLGLYGAPVAVRLWPFSLP